MGVARRLQEFNARHPWSHNEYFHPWILRNLPSGRKCAVDVGCGQGKLLVALAPHFEHVTGTDVDEAMLAEASQRTEALPNVAVTSTQLADLSPGLDLVCMVVVLHHLDVEQALWRIRELLVPGMRRCRTPCRRVSPPSGSRNCVVPLLV